MTLLGRKCDESDYFIKIIGCLRFSMEITCAIFTKHFLSLESETKNGSINLPCIFNLYSYDSSSFLNNLQKIPLTPMYKDKDVENNIRNDSKTFIRLFKHLSHSQT